MISPEYTSAEIGCKIAFLPGGFVALMAGSVSHAKELIRLCRSAMRETPISALNAPDLLMGPVSQLKSRLADQFIQAKLAMSYTEFQNTGRKKLPRDLYSELFHQVSALSSGVELIIAGFADPSSALEPLIYRISGDTVQAPGNFACIGNGAYVAESSLYYREQESTRTLNDTVYCVYEAKRLGERALGVGVQTDMCFLRLSKRRRITMQLVVPPGMDALKRSFDTFGPQPIKRFLRERDHLMQDPFFDRLNTTLAANGDPATRQEEK